MKKTLTVLNLCLLLLAGTTIQGQVLLAKWTFPTGTFADSLADGGIPYNLGMAIGTEGGTSAIDFSKNGATTKAAQATGWDNGAMTKCWVVRLRTTGYKELKLSSKQQSGGNNPGPRDYMVQYRKSLSSEWTDVPNSIMVTANNWTSAALDSIALPDSCANQSMLYLRWIMTTNTNSIGGTLESTGINKIDDIYITGKQITTGVDDLQGSVAFTVSPNPAHGPVTVTSTEVIRSIEILDIPGRVIYSNREVNSTSVTLNHGFAPKGNYFIRVCTLEGRAGSRQVVVF